MRTILALAVLSAGCIYQPPQPAERQIMPDLKSICGSMPWPPPPFSIVPGTYPGQGPNVCLSDADYAAIDGYSQAVREWAKCAEYVGCLQRGGESSQDGCTK